jgi:hypothetical protein
MPPPPQALETDIAEASGSLPAPKKKKRKLSAGRREAFEPFLEQRVLPDADAQRLASEWKDFTPDEVQGLFSRNMSKVAQGAF